MVCSAHCEAVEGQIGVRLRRGGDLVFFALETPPASPQPPPEESLCGEEEALAAGNFPPAEETVPEQLRMWRAHVRGVARSRQKAYAEALSLAQMQFTAWRDVFPVAYDAAMRKQGGAALNEREVQMLDYFAAGYAEFLREVQQIARNGG
jgi:hypothetical protein